MLHQNTNKWLDDVVGDAGECKVEWLMILKWSTVFVTEELNTILRILKLLGFVSACVAYFP